MGPKPFGGPLGEVAEQYDVLALDHRPATELAFHVFGERGKPVRIELKTRHAGRGLAPAALLLLVKRELALEHIRALVRRHRVRRGINLAIGLGFAPGFDLGRGARHLCSEGGKARQSGVERPVGGPRRRRRLGRLSVALAHLEQCASQRHSA